MDPNPFFRDRRQGAAACRRLLATVGLGHLFGELGPEPEAYRLRDAGSLTGDARLILTAALGLFSGDGGPKLRELRLLSEPVRIELALLMRAVEGGPAAVDEWLDAAGPGAPPAGGFSAGGVARA